MKMKFLLFCIFTIGTAYIVSVLISPSTKTPTTTTVAVAPAKPPPTPTLPDAKTFDQLTLWEQCIVLRKSDVYRDSKVRAEAQASPFKLDDYAAMWAIMKCADIEEISKRKEERERREREQSGQEK